MAATELREARDLLCLVYEEQSLDVVDVDSHLADVLRRTGRAEQPRAMLERVIDVREQALRVHPDVAGGLVKYGATLNALGRFAEATAVLQRACTMFGQCSGADHPYVGYAKLALAETLRDAGQCEPARAEAARALAIYTAASEAAHPSAVQAQKLLDELGEDSAPA